MGRIFTMELKDQEGMVMRLVLKISCISVFCGRIFFIKIKYNIIDNFIIE